jgi:hypothetical protein
MVMQTQEEQTLVLATGEKETTMFWRHQAPILDSNKHSQRPSLFSRAFQRKQQRAQQRALVEPRLTEAGVVSDPAPSALAPAGLQPLDIQQLLRHASSLSTTPGTEAADLRRRLAELGPIPEVLQALQDILHNESAADPDLPVYEERHR